MKCVDNNDTVSKDFIGFHVINESLEAEVKPYVFENQSEFVRPYPYHSFSSHYRGEQLLLSY